MFRKAVIFLLFIGVVVVAGSLPVVAQQAPLSGRVVTESADGKKAGVPGALVEIYRTDIKATQPSAKTDKNGNFAFAGVPIVGTFVLSVSAPNCQPQIFPNIKPGADQLTLTVVAGNGEKFTEDQVRQGVAMSPNGTTELTAEQKKARDEQLAKNAAINANNKKIQDADAIAKKSFEDGKAALTAKDYDTAIARATDGVTAVPDYVGSTPALLNIKMVALQLKGYNVYREGAANPDATAKLAKYGEANKLWDAGLESFSQALDVIAKAENPATPADKTQRETLKLSLYPVAIEIHRLKAGGSIDTTKGADATKIITDYIAIEPDPAKKLAAQTTLGDILRNDSDFPGAIAAYRKALELKPDHPEAMAGLGLTLFAQGAAVSPEDKSLEQEGLNYMQKYTEIAPVSATDSQYLKDLKQSIKETVDYLKQQKMTPQKLPTTTTTTTKKRGGGGGI